MTDPYRLPHETPGISFAVAQTLAGDAFECTETHPWGWIFWHKPPMPRGPGAVFILRDGRMERCGSIPGPSSQIREAIERSWAQHGNAALIDYPSYASCFSGSKQSFWRRLLALTGL
jgi:hypothetical protein